MGKSRSWKLRAYLVKEKYSNKELSYFIKKNVITDSFPVNISNSYGEIFVQRRNEKKPEWLTFLNSLAEQKIDGLINKSNAAIFIVKVKERIFAFPFGYGRSMLEESFFESDFGLKTALNTLDRASLKGVDVHNFKEQPVGKRVQAPKASGVNTFGVDVFTDILHRVTGEPKDGVPFTSISGSGPCYGFRLNMKIKDFPVYIQKILDYYKNQSYKEDFEWVDNIRRLRDKGEIEVLNSKLINKIRNQDEKLILSVPEILDWDKIEYFVYPRSRRKKEYSIDIRNYIENINLEKLSIESLKNNDFIEAYDEMGAQSFRIPIFRCLYCEIKEDNFDYILFSGDWYIIDKVFLEKINYVLKEIKESDINFPKINTWKDEDKGDLKIEKEKDYNKKAAKDLGLFLLDGVLVKSTTTTDSIEVCDLLSRKKQLIHVKHRKGGSSSLSHLFAQGKVSAETLLNDSEFRHSTYNKFKEKLKGSEEFIDVDEFLAEDYEIIYVVLGDNTSTVIENLPFFSKVNLATIYKYLTSMGFKVTIAGVEKRSLAKQIQ